MGIETSAAPETAAGAAALPPLECDVIMKGGVTSGLVYPAAVAEIASLYRLRSIGGTSAGAIAAAGAAAMEFGRISGRNPASVDLMAGLAAEMGTPGADGTPLLLRLFEPDPDSADLFRLALAARKRSETKGLSGIAWLLAGRALIVSTLLLALGVAALVSFLPSPLPAAVVVVLIAVILLGLPAMTILLTASRWLPPLLRNLRSAAAGGFGLCSGMARHQDEAGRTSPALGEWLHDRFQALAGLPADAPLTFGDLWTAASRRGGATRDEAFAAARAVAADGAALPDAELPRDIDLALVASDINRAQSVQLPFFRREDRLYARLSDLAFYFPPAIVAAMKASARPSELAGVDLGGIEESDLIALPEPRDLPVLFAVRMSLSFPFLFRAVRLYLVRRHQPQGGGPSRAVLSEIWLADGGITSNFPIHLFDAPIPTRPTFCINLLYHDDELAPDDRGLVQPEDGEAEPPPAPESADPEQLVHMLRTNYGRLSRYTPLDGNSGIGGLGRFAARVFSTARQWGDNQLLDVPGYRDRIVHIRMRDGEGGLNLDMDRARIADLQARGRRAGSAIAQRFLPSGASDPLWPDRPLVLNWTNHRMVRFRAFIAGLEVTASHFSKAWETDLDVASSSNEVASIEQIVTKAGVDDVGLPQRTGYAFRNATQRQLALDIAAGIRELDERFRATAPVGVDFVHGKPTSPRPKSTLRLRPSVGSDPLQER